MLVCARGHAAVRRGYVAYCDWECFGVRSVRLGDRYAAYHELT